MACPPDYIIYREGYIKALIDIAGFINRPNAPLAKKLLTAKRLDAVMDYITRHADEFMKCPDLFEFEFEIGKNGAVIFKEAAT